MFWNLPQRWPSGLRPHDTQQLARGSRGASMWHQGHVWAAGSERGAHLALLFWESGGQNSGGEGIEWGSHPKWDSDPVSVN